MTDKEAGAFYMARNEGTGVYDARHELLHPETKRLLTGDTLTETQYFGFNIPEHRIHGLTYLWWHPNLGTVSGGVWAFQGIKPHTLASEIFDWRPNMSEKALANDLHDYTLDMGLRARIVEPGKSFHVQYEDARRGNRLDITFDAVMPPYVFGDNRHFEQTMKTRGEIVLRGQRYDINGYSVRDRSWGALRAEHLEPVPPVTWMSGAFGDDFSFCCSAFDHPDLGPDWAGQFDFPADRVCIGGYVRRDGETLDIVDCRKRTVHNERTLYPESIEMEITDRSGRRFVLKGTIIAACSFSQWQNMTVPLCLAKWECGERVGYGDVQDVQWSDYVFARLGRKSTTEVV